MFQRILITTDDSTVARKAVKAGIALAKDVGAAVIAYYAVEAIERRVEAPVKIEILAHLRSALACASAFSRHIGQARL